MTAPRKVIALAIALAIAACSGGSRDSTDQARSELVSLTGVSTGQ